jgi:TusA-related sulfurtransferase
MEKTYANRLEDQYEILAYHYKISENLEKALQHMILAGEKPAGLFANEDARAFYEESSRIADKLSDEQTRKRYLNDIQTRMKDIPENPVITIKTSPAVQTADERMEAPEPSTGVAIDKTEVDILDTSGETCLMPEILLEKRLKTWKSGETLKFITDDLPAIEFIPRFCEKKGYRCVIENQAGDKHTFLIT